MKNTTNCVVVWRAYVENDDTNDTNNKTVRVKEYLFRDDVSCRRYCVLVGRKYPIITDVTEHPPKFFDSVINAECGFKLYNVYISEEIDPVPIGEHVPYTKKYEYLRELCVSFNILFEEESIVEALNKSRKCRSKYALLNYDASI